MSYFYYDILTVVNKAGRSTREEFGLRGRVIEWGDQDLRIT